VISSELDSLTGLMHGSTIAALSSGQRPAFTTADDDFGGRPSFTCESASTGKFLQGTLGASIAAGSYPGLFIVGSVVTPLGGSARCSLGLCEASDHSSAILICADDVNVAGHYGAVYADGATVFAVAGAAIDTGPHVIAAYADPPTTGGLGFRFDLEAASVATPGAGPLTSALTKLSLGASWDGADYSGADIKIAYVAVLKSAVPVAVMSRAISLARARYGLF